jgi:hypothetical protein
LSNIIGYFSATNYTHENVKLSFFGRVTALVSAVLMLLCFNDLFMYALVVMLVAKPVVRGWVEWDDLAFRTIASCIFLYSIRLVWPLPESVLTFRDTLLFGSFISCVGSMMLAWVDSARSVRRWVSIKGERSLLDIVKEQLVAEIDSNMSHISSFVRAPRRE